MPRIVVGIPVYNEAPVLPDVIPRLCDLVARRSDIEVVIVDDGSSDGTQAILRNASSLNTMRSEKRRGVGVALAGMLRYARSIDATHLIVFPGNGKLGVEEIEKLIPFCNRSEAIYVRGSRFLPGGDFSAIPRFRLGLVSLGTKIVRWIFHVPVTDLTCSLRLIPVVRWNMRLNLLARMGGYGFEQIVTIVGLMSDCKYEEVPVRFRSPLNRPHSYVGLWGICSIVAPWICFGAMLVLHRICRFLESLCTRPTMRQASDQ